MCLSEKLIKDIPNIFGIADEILIVGCDADRRDGDRAPRQVMQLCQQENLELNTNQCHFRCMKILFFVEVISRGVQPDPKKLHMLTEMSPNNEKDTF